MGYITDVNVIRDNLYDLISAAGLKNKLSTPLPVRMHKRILPEFISLNDCPFISIFKRTCEGNVINTDQPDVELPQGIHIIIQICDGSSVDMDKAEELTDDLAEKVIVVLKTDVSLSGKVKGILIPTIEFDEEKAKGVFFSVVRFDLEVQGTDLI